MLNAYAWPVFCESSKLQVTNEEEVGCGKGAVAAAAATSAAAGRRSTVNNPRPLLTKASAKLDSWRGAQTGENGGLIEYHPEVFPKSKRVLRTPPAPKPEAKITSRKPT